MQKSFECNLKGRLGTGCDDLKEMRVLNRIVRVTEHGILYEADPRHAEMLIRAFHLGDSKPVVTPEMKTSVMKMLTPINSMLGLRWRSTASLRNSKARSHMWVKFAVVRMWKSGMSTRF